MDIKQVRDITVIDFDDKRYLGISCDSCGGIGTKEHDVVKASLHLVAYQTGKVALAELLSLGFSPFLLADGLAVEMHDTGKQLIEGFSDVISRLKTAKVHITGSTEENIPTVQTSMGITCIGVCEKDKLKYKKTRAGHVCMLLGLPLVGNDVVNNPDKILDIEDFEVLYLSNLVKEMLPVGSRGTEAELEDLCEYNNLEFAYNDNLTVDLTHSGGPSCCCLVVLKEKNIDEVKKLVKKPAEVLGHFINKQ